MSEFKQNEDGDLLCPDCGEVLETHESQEDFDTHICESCGYSDL